MTTIREFRDSLAGDDCVSSLCGRTTCATCLPLAQSCEHCGWLGDGLACGACIAQYSEAWDADGTYIGERVSA